MATHNDKPGVHSSASEPAGPEEVRLGKALLKDDRDHRIHLVRTLLFITVTTIVVFIHQIFLVSSQISELHNLAHVVLLVVTLVLLIGTWVTWSSFYKLHHRQKAVLDALTDSTQLVASTGKSLRKSETLLESLFGAVTDRILVVDSNNRIIKANRIAGEWAGFDPSLHDFTEVFPICDNQGGGERRSELRLIELTRSSQKAYHGRLLRGGVDCLMLLSVDTYPVSLPESDSDLVIEIARDVTDQTGHELAVRHKEKMASLGLLVAGFAHDIGNPLASLSTELELIRENEPEKIYESLDKISEYVARIKRKLHDIVQFARSTGENRPDVNIYVAIDHALKLTRYDPRAHRIHFKIEVPDQLIKVKINEDDLVLALINLIVNAFDAMPQGGTLSISVSTTHTGEILLTVADTGIGMDAATLEQATRPLFTTKVTADAHGTGLGLTMVKQVMESAGGELMLESNPGHGTRAILRMPVEETKKSS